MFCILLEIRSISAEPNYKSVNLSWEVEFVPQNNKDCNNNNKNNSMEISELPKAFVLFICEMQSFGPHRCRSKTIDDHHPLPPQTQMPQLRHYKARVDNLRMATKYSFHIRPQFRRRDVKITGRSELFQHGIEETQFANRKNDLGASQTIIVPTKGFTAEATKCLPNASEIEVETGPYFAGKIMVDGGKCLINGNPNNPSDRYTMRIDHKQCGSMVKPETNTVETFITVQENPGIFTHSTRRFVVVCSFQSGMQTVRASFSVPGRSTAVADTPKEEERKARLLQPIRYVNKTELVLKETNENLTSNYDEGGIYIEETDALIKEIQNSNTTTNTTADEQKTPLTLLSSKSPTTLNDSWSNTTQLQEEEELPNEVMFAKLIYGADNNAPRSLTAYKEPAVRSSWTLLSPTADIALITAICSVIFLLITILTVYGLRRKCRSPEVPSMPIDDCIQTN